jgi:hypothetical protein
MTNEQLSVLLFHLVRQINEGTNKVECALVERGYSIEEAAYRVMDLRSLADVLHGQCAELTAHRSDSQLVKP